MDKRFITIQVEGREPPVLDISDFSVYEAHGILSEAVDALEALKVQPIVTAGGVVLEGEEVGEDVEEDTE